MRFEAKNHQLKRFVGLNFKNVPKSVASRHQNKMCLNMLSSPGNNTTFLQRRCYWKRYGYIITRARKEQVNWASEATPTLGCSI